jgi:hypothetical protein
VPGSFACVRRCSPSERGRSPRWRDGVSRREPRPSPLHKGDACDHSRIEGAVIHRDELGLQRFRSGASCETSTICLIPYIIDTSDPSTLMWMCPVFGVRCVDVVGVIVPPMRRSRTTSSDPETVWPGVGETISRRAVDLGRIFAICGRRLGGTTTAATMKTGTTASSPQATTRGIRGWLVPRIRAIPTQRQVIAAMIDRSRAHSSAWDPVPSASGRMR